MSKIYICVLMTIFDSFEVTQKISDFIKGQYDKSDYHMNYFPIFLAALHRAVPPAAPAAPTAAVVDAAMPAAPAP